MMIKSPQKRNGVANIQLPIDSDVSYNALQRSYQIPRCFMIDDALKLEISNFVHQVKNPA